MPAPVKPSDFKALIPQGSGSVCTALKNAVLRLPALLYQLVKYIWNEDGTLTADILADIGVVAGGDGTGTGTGTTIPAPSGVSATDGASVTKITVTWGAVANASYIVFRSEGDDPAAAIQVATTSEEEYEDFVDGNNVLINVHYNYWVKATNGSQTSGFSSSDSGYASATAAGGSGKYTKKKNTGSGYVNWTVPTGVTSLDSVKVWGAGGGGGGGGKPAFAPAGSTDFYSGGGGGGGGYKEVTSVAVTAGDVFRVYVGKAGSSGSTPDGSGGSGKSTKLVKVSTGSTIVAAGGGRGGEGGGEPGGGGGGAGGAGNGGADGSAGTDGGLNLDPGTGGDSGSPIDGNGNGGDGGGDGQNGDVGEDGRIEITWTNPV